MSFRSRARPAARSSKVVVTPQCAVQSAPRADLPSLLPFFYFRKFHFRTTRLLEHELVARKFHLIHSGGERRFNFDTVLIAKFVFAGNISDLHRAVARKFPDCLIVRPGHSPFTDNAGVPAAG